MSALDVGEAITRVHHEEWARVVASLTRRFGDLDIAEEAAAEAFATAVERWPADGVPPNPGGWLTTTATRKAIDRIRREHKRDDKQEEARMLHDDDPTEPLGAIDDDRLRLIFTCCHPALAMETRVALTLRMVGGLTVQEIARAFLTQEAAMGQRITRAKAKIKVARIPYRVPSAEDLPARVSGVLAVLFLVFNEGYLASGPDTDPVRHDLTAEAIRLTRLVRALMPRGRRGGRTAGADAPHRGAPHRPGLGERRTGPPRRAGPWGLGRGAGRRGASAGARAPGRRGGSGSLSDPRGHQRRPHLGSRRCATPTGRRSSPCTTSSSASTLLRSSPSTGPSRSPSSTARRWRWPPSTVWTTRWPATTRITRPAPTCCAGWAANEESRAAYDEAIELAGNTAETAYLTRRRDQLA